MDMHVIDEAQLEEFLDMDDDEERSFTTDLLNKFFAETEELLPAMQALLAHHDLEELSRKGHFIKGSAAMLGAAQVRDIANQIQHYEPLVKERFTEGMVPSQIDFELFVRDRLQELGPAVAAFKNAIGRRVSRVF